MKATVTWQDNLKFIGETDTGHSLEMDASSKSISPMESVLLAVGSCSSIDVVDILRKSRKHINSCVCELDTKRAENAPRVFTAIHAHYIVSGDDLSEKIVARAVQLSAEKYCSVMLMLAGNVEITTSYALI
ncbi:OsmC family protein [Paraglaciecola sp.]|uniref:OsmC family protein n=1 Tax=Paraglaciecola sp. TaxID=1920173 RepID=UPI003265E966